MARRPAPKPTHPTLLIPRAEAETKLSERIDKGNELRSRQINDRPQLEEAQTEYNLWSGYNTELLKRIFSNTSISEEYGHVGFSSVNLHPTLKSLVDDFRRDLDREISRLLSVKERLELIPQPTSTTVPLLNKPELIQNKDVFIVHGHDEALKQTVARLITQLGFNPIILHEQPNSGRTIIEKFEANAANVAFAIVIMSPDDLGAIATDSTDLKPRARQNVVFELGYFIGKLGRDRVCALRIDDVEILSDYLGVVYVPVDAGGAWRYAVAKEMKAAKINVDLNLIK